MPQSARQDPKFLKEQEIPSSSLVFREFKGVNVTSPRQSINDEQFSWLENLFPIADGNMPVVNAATYEGVTQAHAVILEVTANIGGTDYSFDFLSDGSAYYTTIGGFVSTQFATPATFTAPQAIPYTSNNGTPGLLIIDPSTGYYDFGLTTALTLTRVSSTLSAPAITNPGGGYTAAPTIGFTGGGGAGATATAFIGVRNAVLVAAGTGYLAGDQITVSGGSSQVAAVFSITTVNGAGGITAFAIQTIGQYTTIPANPAGVTGGAGTGATFTLTWGLSLITLTNPGHSYTSAPTYTGLNSSGGTGAAATITLNGTLNGTALAAYAGRVWIANGKSISYTDINSYNSFGGVGGQLTINDSYLHNNINALYATNGYLYIFGDDSIDLLSNVVVSSGVTSFSRVNITSSIGTNLPQSIFPYYRSLMFATQYGIYSLSGSTPQKISDDLDGLFKPGVFVGGLVAGAVTIFGELCMTWTFRIVDNFTTLYGTGVTRTIMVVYYKQRWFFAYPGFDLATIISVTSTAGQNLYGYTIGAAPKLYKLFAANNSNMLGFLRTKLWDGGVPIQDKEVLRAGIGFVFAATINRAVTLTTDNEFFTEPVPRIGSESANQLNFVNNLGQPLNFVNNSNQPLQFVNSLFAYEFDRGAASLAGGKYFGMSVTVNQTDLTLSMLAIQYRSTTIW